MFTDNNKFSAFTSKPWEIKGIYIVAAHDKIQGEEEGDSDQQPFTFHLIDNLLYLLGDEK